MLNLKSTILVIDDDATLHSLVKARLEQRDGHKVLSEMSGPAGLKVIKKSTPDLILLDWMMPEMSGLEVLKALKDKESTSKIPIYMLTGKGVMADIEEAFSLGADGYFTKPIALGDLSQKIRKALFAIKKN